MQKGTQILRTLQENNFKAYIVGGAVRDKLLGFTPHDVDITTDATPAQVTELFTKVIPSGIAFGTVTVMLGNDGYEITTFRTDGEYLDGRRPTAVTFGTDIIDDLARRDFTINAMALDLDGNVIDPFGGRADLEAGIIRTVGNPTTRFKEDALRMLRAFRFSAKLGFKIEKTVLDAIKVEKGNLKKVSAERVRDEFTKILLSDNVEQSFDSMFETGVLNVLLPEVARMHVVKQNHPYHIHGLFKHTLVSVDQVVNVPVLRWAMLLHDLGKVETKSVGRDGFDHFFGHPEVSAEKAKVILTRLKCSNAFIDEVIELIIKHDEELGVSENKVRKAKSSLKNTTLEYLICVKAADARAQNPKYLGRLDDYSEILKISDKEPVLSLKDLPVNGNDLMERGLQGKEVGDALNRMFRFFLEDPTIPKETLINLVC